MMVSRLRCRLSLSIAKNVLWISSSLTCVAEDSSIAVVECDLFCSISLIVSRAT